VATDLGGPTPTSNGTDATRPRPRRAATAAGHDASPPAARAARPGWRDPRLWIGILIVAGCVVSGARIIGASDDTVAMWAVSRDVGAGETLEPDDLVATRVHFADSGTGAGYFAVTQQLPADLRVTRGLAAGELLPRGAVGSAEQADTVEVPVALDADQVPGSVAAGSVVDVYLLAGSAAEDPPGDTTGGGGRGGDAPALSGVTVVEAPPPAEGFSASGKRQLVLAVSERDARRFFALLGSAQDPQLTVVRRG